MVNAYDTLSDGQSWTHTLQNEVGTALGAVDSVGFRPYKSARYIIYAEDSTYYRVDGNNGEVDASSTNAATLIQNAYDAMADGELLLLRTAVYDTTTGLVFDDKGKWVSGEGYRNTSIRYTGVGTAVTVGTASSETESHWGGLRNLRIYDKDGTAAVGLLVIQRFGVFENLYIQGFLTGVGLKLQPGSTTFSTYYNDFRSLIVNESLNGIHIEGNATKQTNANRFFGGQLDGVNNTAGSIGINIDYSDTCLFYGMALDDFETAVDIDANSSKHKFIPLRIEDMTDGMVVAGDRNYFWGINFNVTGTELTVSGDENRFIFCEFPSSPTITNTGTGNIFEQCRNYLTDNSGASTGSGATQNIAHGLGTTPNRITFGQTSVQSAGNYPVQISGANATYIFVSAGAGVTYDWHTWVA